MNFGILVEIQIKTFFDRSTQVHLSYYGAGTGNVTCQKPSEPEP
jgi:hypothetical protein